MKANELSSFVTGYRDQYDLVVQVEVLGQIVVKKIVSLTADDRNKQIYFHPEKIELK
jgi:hypothetical protein